MLAASARLETFAIPEWHETQEKSPDSMPPEILADHDRTRPWLHAQRWERRSRSANGKLRNMSPTRPNNARKRRDAQLALQLVQALKETTGDLEAAVGD